MFVYDYAHWAAFFAASLDLNLAPWPDIALILAQPARGGRRARVAAMFGIWTGAGGHVLMAALGLSAVLAASATAFTAVKWIGAGYLIWLGLNALLRPGGGFEANGMLPVQSQGRIYRQGILVALLNPKVAVFFLAFLPQFVVPGAGPVPAQLFLHGMLIIAVAALVEPPLVMLGARLARGIQARPGIGIWLDRTLGVVLIGLGLKLATARSL
jgi:threonine/homoserine/homoserine lactone efflux protein